MPSSVYTFRDGERIYFDKGKFDDWCVYLQPEGGRPRPPHDTDYFTELRDFGEKYGYERIYSNFKAIYDLTDKQRRFVVFDLIGEQGRSLEEADYLPYAKLMVTLYYAMIAEERREPPEKYPLKKKVKKIGVFQVLIERMTPVEAANFSRGKRAKWLLEVLAKYEKKEAEIGL